MQKHANKNAGRPKKAGQLKKKKEKILGLRSQTNINTDRQIFVWMQSRWNSFNQQQYRFESILIKIQMLYFEQKQNKKKDKRKWKR